jgi:hypothetical protein
MNFVCSFLSKHLYPFGSLVLISQKLADIFRSAIRLNFPRLFFLLCNLQNKKRYQLM